MLKAGEYKDYTAEQAVQGKDTTVSKLGELKDSAADAARKAMDFLTGKKEEVKQKTEETGEAAKVSICMYYHSSIINMDTVINMMFFSFKIFNSKLTKCFS